MQSQIIARSSLPKYRQLADIMVTEIRDKNLGPGNRFLSEHLWAARFKVSRPTVRQAVQCLEREGLLKREQGRGTFVAAPPVLTGANLPGVTWSSTTCPDGTNSNNDSGTCSGHLG